MHRSLTSGLRARPFSFIWISMLLFALVLALASCGNDAGSPGAPTTPVPTSGGGYNYGQPTPTAGVTPTAVVATPTSAVSGPTETVTIVSTGGLQYGFSPATLTITVGTTVMWKNSSKAPHTVTSDDGQSFASNAISPGDSFSFSFTKAGTYKYHCEFHSYMVATIIVQ